ncbi:fusarinine C synthase [Geosmithia morbida]|uniref:Brevianamide F synthase n=1 Tax=Geosmithia morbida TaxID=1094350 RepID=A0A9P4YR82_9HYPO|nr:fusarinine C synthase [Geosmithia morbida]KAF4121626.1 fusarinine C synthase [Geosmithia morbida]
MRTIDNDGGGGAARSMVGVDSQPEELTATKESLGVPDAPSNKLSTQDINQLWEWNRNVPPLLSTCVQDIISEQARTHPDDVAVQSWDGSLTYGELEELSSRISYHLVSNEGVAVGTRIPLCFEKSMWAIVGLLGVMKAGATFSLTDPSQPEARLRTIVEQTGARLVITSRAQSDLGGRIVSGIEAGRVLAVSRDLVDSLPPTATSSATVSLPTVPPSSPMYVIFTSGSTGKPKGVVISHENFTSGALPRADAVGYTRTSRCFDFPSYAFDVSIDCMLCTLCKGGRVCVPSEEARMNNLSGAIRDSGANMVHMTPSVARVLDDDIIPSLDVLGLGGEAVSPSDAANWGRHTSLVIAYGPSECTVGCTINNTVNVSTGIGKGCGGVTWIANPEDHNLLTPIGEVGELLIEGPLVGIGYLDEPAKTAEVFIEDPAWLLEGGAAVPGGRHGRLYKTGDLVRYESNMLGSIEFVGRKDQQVKLRGQRVELAEVEHHLQSCLPSGVKVAAEVIKPEKGAPALVAFLAESSAATTTTASDGGQGLLTEPSPDLAAAIASIDTTMGANVPRYMIPAAFVALHKMPSLVSGKIDRKSLRAIGASMPRDKLNRFQDAAGGEANGPEEEPETDDEKKLQAAWTQVLGLGPETKIFRQSNFFNVGGDSLRAMKLVSAAREQGLSITVADIFMNATLRDMALKAQASHATTEQEDIPPFSLLDKDWPVDEARKAAAELCGVPVEDIEDMYPCTPLQEALMALSAKVKEAYVAQRVVELDSRETGDRLIKAFDTAQADCHILRTRIVQVPGRGLVQVVVGGQLQYHAGTRMDEYLVSDRDDPMDLGKPLVRYALIEDEATSKVGFVLTMHHALYDGWAMPLVVERINRAYEGQSTSRPADFKHFIKYLMSKDRSESETFWRERLEGGSVPQFPLLPYAGYQTKADSLLEKYVSLGRQPVSGTTVATVIRAAWALVASQYVHTDDVIFGETLTGRNAPIIGADEIEGPMITTIPIRVSLDREALVVDYLREMQDQTVAQIPHEHYGLQHIRRLSPDALEACELRTGLVLHPSTAEDEAALLSSDLPANRLVPAGDAEAAQEALKFNTYALMLVCSIDPEGFLIMASFDSHTVDVPTMERVLDQVERVAQQLCAKTSSPVGDIPVLTSADVDQFAEHNRAVAAKAVPQDVLEKFPGSEAVYVVDNRDPHRPLPHGALGELVVGASPSTAMELTRLTTVPSWVEKQDLVHYKTGKLAKYTASGEIVLTGSADAKPDAISGAGAGGAARPAKRVSASSRKQKKLRSLWSRVLRIPEEDIGLNDSFFNLGGDSISAMKLVSEARVDGIILTVMQIFQKRSLYDLASAVKEEDTTAVDAAESAAAEIAEPFSLLSGAAGITDVDGFLRDTVRPQLADASANVVNVYPARPLQEVAVLGTTNLPRFSARYELMFFDKGVDADKVSRSARELVQRNEILRTVFIRHAGHEYGVVLDSLATDLVHYETDSPDLRGFVHKLCDLDSLSPMPRGSSFVKWFLVRGAASGGGEPTPSCLVMRVSHAQYDEICLPLLLRQLSALLEGKPVQDTVPFSSFVGHVLNKSIPASISYWKDLLAGSSMTILRPPQGTPSDQKTHFAIEKTIDVTSRPRETTAATLPTAAWALCLARRLSLRDVTFGEVVSGRNIDFPGADAVAGPCWQYVPVRVRFDDSWTVLDLLDHVQHQHVATSAHEALGISEVVERCTDWNVGVPDSDDSDDDRKDKKKRRADHDGKKEKKKRRVDWFDTVVHQDVEHVESLDLAATGSRMETLYTQQEPLREWKMQAFFSADGKMTLEIVTIDSWADFAREVLDDVVSAAKFLVEEPRSKLFA